MALLWLAMALHGAWVKSPVMDEPAHIGDGFAILDFGDYRFNPEHPPLFKVLSALPAWVFLDTRFTVGPEGPETRVWRARDSSLWGYTVIYFHGAKHRLRLFMCRIVPVLTGLLGGLLAYAWGRELKGRTAGLAAMGLLMFYPEYLGHSRFVTLDVPTLVAVAGMTLAAWKTWQRPTNRNVAVFVVACAAGSLIKLPVTVAAIVLWGCMALFLPLRLRDREDMAGISVRRFAALTAVLFAAGVFAQWAGAGFRFLYETGIVVPHEPRPFMREDIWRPPLGWILTPLSQYRLLPQATIAVIAHVGTVEGRPVFLLGEDSFSGWYHYFAVTTALKTPFWHLLLLPVALAWAGWRLAKGTATERTRLVLFAAPFLVLLALTVVTRLNIGHRHILFVYFPWTVLAGAAIADVLRAQRVRHIATAAIALLCALQCLWLHPHHATYMNAIGGGSPLAGRTRLRDSNVDWGQDLGYAVETVIDMGYLEANLAYFGMGRPEAYGLDDVRLMLPNYPWTIRFKDHEPPDPTLPTIVSVNAIHAVDQYFPGGLDEEPAFVCNSVIVYAPKYARGR